MEKEEGIKKSNFDVLEFLGLPEKELFTYDEEHFMVDLVFYNRKLRCFVLFDLKKTIGIILCKDRNKAIVEMTLPEDNTQIFASKYETVLPQKDDLKNCLKNIKHKIRGTWDG